MVFEADDAVVASTSDPNQIKEFMQRESTLLHTTSDETDVRLGSERFMEASPLLSGPGAPRVRLVVLKSYDEASRYLIQLDRLLIGLGFCVLVIAGGLATYISASITRPLEALVAGARALGSGKFRI